MRILAIDPAPTESGYIIWDGVKIYTFGIANNEKICESIVHSTDISNCIIEKVACFGMPVGKSVLDTCEWTGRFDQQWFIKTGERAILITKNQVQLHHCKTTKANDSNVIQALCDKYAYGVRNYGKGIKKEPGFFYGFKEDVWDAFALATTYTETNGSIGR